MDTMKTQPPQGGGSVQFTHNQIQTSQYIFKTMKQKLERGRWKYELKNKGGYILYLSIFSVDYSIDQ